MVAQGGSWDTPLGGEVFEGFSALRSQCGGTYESIVPAALLQALTGGWMHAEGHCCPRALLQGKDSKQLSKKIRDVRNSNIRFLSDVTASSHRP